MSQIEFTNLQGEKVLIEKDRVIFRPSVYGIILHEGKILLQNVKSTGKFTLAGGGMNLGESVEEALRREVREECGIEIIIEGLISFEERFFYYDPLDKPWHVLAPIYVCSPVSIDVTDMHNEADDESEKPQWIPIDTLTTDQFQVFGEAVTKYFAHR